MIGKTIGPYEVVAKLGEGGMGEVYRARDTRIDRTVAIKVLGADATGNLEGRFEREARALATLSQTGLTGDPASRRFVATADGNRFLFNMLREGDRAATTTTLQVVLNWSNGLAR